MANVIKNRASTNNGTDFYVASTAVAVAATTQPKTTSGASAGLGTSRTLLDNTSTYKVRNGVGIVTKGRHSGVSAAIQTSTTAITSVGTNGSYPAKCRFVLAAHGLTVGTVILVTGCTDWRQNGLHTITAADPLSDAGAFDTNVPYFAAGGTILYSTPSTTYNFNTLTKGRYVIMGGGSTQNYIAGVANTALRSPAYNRNSTTIPSHLRRTVHTVENMHGVKLTTALRANYWSVFHTSVAWGNAGPMWTTCPTLIDGSTSLCGDTYSTGIRNSGTPVITSACSDDAAKYVVTSSSTTTFIGNIVWAYNVGDDGSGSATVKPKIASVTYSKRTLV
jgi:hypothetical protein